MTKPCPENRQHGHFSWWIIHTSEFNLKNTIYCKYNVVEHDSKCRRVFQDAVRHDPVQSERRGAMTQVDARISVNSNTRSVAERCETLLIIYHPGTPTSGYSHELVNAIGGQSRRCEAHLMSYHPGTTNLRVFH